MIDHPRLVSLSSEKRWARLLFVTVALLPFATVPLELAPGKISLSTPIVASVLMLGIRYAAFSRGFPTAVDFAAAGLAIWIVARLLLIAPATGEEVAWPLLARESGALLAGVVIFRIAQRSVLQPTILRALWVGFLLLVLLEAYQLHTGLPALQAAGYETANGFFYYTFEGSYRPFGTFSGPTTFGTFLAMVGMFLALSRSRRTLVVVGSLTAIGVVLTDTRAAWLGAALALGVVALSSRSELRRRAAAALLPGVPALAIAVLIWPSIFVGIWERLMSLTDLSDTSRQTRLALWDGVIDATAKHGAVFDGFGGAGWAHTMSSEVSRTVLNLGHAHSNYFQEWFRYGIVGTALFTWLVLAMLVIAVRGLNAGRLYGFGAVVGTIIFAVDSVFNNSLSSVNFVLIAFLLLGMGAGTTGPEQIRQVGSEERGTVATR